MRKGSEAKKILSSTQIHEGKTASVQDIVEVQMTLAVVRGKKNAFRMKPILRAIVLLSGEYMRVRVEISSNRSD